MASRRLDISSLLCDDNPPPFSPLDALVHAATEERRRLDAVPAPSPKHPAPLPRPYYDSEMQHKAAVPQVFDGDRHRRQQLEVEIADMRAQHVEFQRQQQERDRLNLLRAQELGRRHREEEERRRFEEYELQLGEQREYEMRLQSERIREREMEHRKREEHRELERLQIERVELERREMDRRDVLLRREHQQREAAERQQREAAERQQREAAEHRLNVERRREQERLEEIHRRAQLPLGQPHRFLETQPIATTSHAIAHATTSHHPSISHLISHSPPLRKPDLPHISALPTSIPHDPPTIAIPSSSQDDPRPIKKRRYSESPTRPISDDKERIARERDKMLIGELGYGRVESPSSATSHPPRRPGSGHGHSRKPVAVSDLLVDRERAPAARSESRGREAHRVLSPLGGRRSPPGSQIGRAKAARKSDDHLLREPPPPPITHQVVHIPAEPEPRKEPKVKEPKPSRPRISSDGARPPNAEDVRSKKPPAPAPAPAKDAAPLAPPPSTKSQPVPPKSQQDDAHEWFLQQYDEEPSPTTSSRHEPPHTPSPSASPVTPNHPPSNTVAPAVKSPPSNHKALVPISADVSLEQELEDLVSKPVSIAATLPTAAIVKQQEADIDMDLDVDLAVTELVNTLDEADDDEVKHEPPAMEVDVEDELLSLVDDRAPPPPASSSASTAVRRTAGPSTTISNSAPTHGSAATSSLPHPHPHPRPHSAAGAKQQPADSKHTMDARQGSPLPSLLSSTSLAASRHTSTRPTSERGSMPPPVITSVGASAKKGAERAGSVSPAIPTSASATTVSGTTAAPKKKKESTTKSATNKAKATTGATSSTTTTASMAAKPRAKPAAKAKKGTATDSASLGIPSTTASASSKRSSKPPGTAATKKNGSSVSRSRSTSVMPPGSVSVGPESDVKAEKQEEEEESDAAAANEDDKLYCVCKTKYDEDRFMIACDRCDEWYHTNCLHMSDLEVDLVDQFICPLCIEKNPHLNLRTTYKQRCLYGLRHPDPNSTKACHKAARGAFSKYCSDECGLKYMQSRIDNWAKKGGKTEKLWESVKNADKREGVVCAVEIEEEADEEPPKVNGDTNGCSTMEVDRKAGDGDNAAEDKKPLSKELKQKPPLQKLKSSPQQIKQRLVPPTKTKIGRETERLNGLLESVIKMREELKRGMEIVVWRERLLQLATERAEIVDQCGWDQRLCMDDQEWADNGAAVLESYDDLKTEGVKDEDDGDMDVDGAEEQWWCPGNKVCDRHQGWQAVRSKDVAKEKEKKEEALSKLTTKERELRKRIEDMLDPHKTTNPSAANTTVASKEAAAPHAPLKASNTKAVNGHPKAKGATSNGDTAKKGKKRKAPAS